MSNMYTGHSVVLRKLATDSYFHGNRDELMIEVVLSISCPYLATIEY